MSFGDPNNPYGQQPQAPQGQPGYGYPQQAPQGIPPQGQPGYGYPQQGAPAGYPGGYPGAPMQMPGLLKTSRVLLFIIGGLQIIGGIGMAIGGAAVTSVSSSSSSSSTSTAGGMVGGVLVFIGVLFLAMAALSIFLGVKFAKGGNGIRVTTIVYASISLLGSLANFANIGSNGAAPGAFGGIVGLALGGIILASVVGSSGAAWFKRPRF
ncbi:hypothetical protein OHS33_22055 [Streptomyces sp. NBC_00536]|uniref:hypothetical protein n=1 Tax=Streptomyces sp. NBC_00536 TaxID=2975769 RepID=UPI002E8191C9|nr:hypothetical protein [Streptomyces sp. NBC_00536]WUC80777.1 hypothetical protein OHS33_22055 [Streptomyces sp. NBC_00536]